MVSLFFSLVELPISLYRTFEIEERFGFNKSTLKLWVFDRLKGVILSGIIATPLLLALFWFMDRAGPWWWVYASVTVVLFQLVLVYVFPVWIAPLFNKFTPLEGVLSDRIVALSEKLGFKIAGVFSMDGSRRSGHGNAYFTGFGGSKRIVLFDTLIQQMTEDQVLAVLAHEIGHQKMGHVKKMLFVSCVMTVLGFWAVSLGMNTGALYTAFGFERSSSHAALIIFSFLSGPVLFFASPLFSALSRRHEYQADKYAREAMGESVSLSRALIVLSKNNLSNLTPHPLYSAVHYSHPTLIERLRALQG